MPTIDINLGDLKELVGQKFPADVEKLEPYIHNIKGEVDGFENGVLTLSMGDSNRPDLWCAEGIARELRGMLGAELGLKKYVMHPSDYRIIVNSKLEELRGYIACVVVKDLKLSDLMIKQLMQMQDKIDTSYGRNRKKTSIGMYKFDKLKWPLKYTTTKPHEHPFVPLNFTEPMAPHEILKAHPKGIEYGNILKGLEEYPLLIDSTEKVLSMPPIINSNDLGQINETDSNILVEVTGTDYGAVNGVLRIISLSLADRGGKLYQVQIDYPYRKIDNTPHLETRNMPLSIAKAGELLGLKLDAKDVIKLLQKMRYGISSESEQSLEVEVPSYRTDVMHAVDICEDIAIACGYGNFKPEVPSIPSSGKLADIERISNKFRELCIGLGAQEIMNFTLTNKTNLFTQMNSKEEKVIEIENPVSLTYGCLRNKLLPSVLEFLSKNTTHEFPQKVFEIGDIVHLNLNLDEMSHTERRLSFAISDSNVTFTEIKQALESIFANLGIKMAVVEYEHESFIVGRCAAVMSGKERLGVMGEIHPQVLSNWGLEMPVVAFEVKISI